MNIPNKTQRWGIRVVEPEDELLHYGRKGQHWGDRLYQNKDGSLTPLGRLRYGSKPAGVGVRKKSKEEKKKAKEEALKKKEAKKKQKEEEEAAEKKRRDDEERERIVKSGDAETILKNKDKLSEADLRAAATRLQLESQIAGYSKKAESTPVPKFDNNPKESSKPEKKSNFDKAMDAVDKAFKIGESAVDKIESTGKAAAKITTAYNTIAKISNFATGEDSMKIIEDFGYYTAQGAKLPQPKKDNN